MSTDRDTTRLVRSWLEEGVTRLPDRVLDAVLDEVPTTPQRQPMRLPWRSSPMTPAFKGVLASAAVVAAVAVALTALTPGGPGGHPNETPVPTASATVALPTPSPFGKRVTIGPPFERAVEVTVPNDWTPNTQKAGQFDFSGASGPYVGFFLIDSVYKDPCHPELGVQPLVAGGLGHSDPPPSQLDGSRIVLQLQELAGFDATTPTSISIDGLPAERLTLTNAIDTATAGCTNGQLLPLFIARGTDVSTNGGTTVDFYVIQSAVASYLVVAAEGEAGDQQLIDRIVASIKVRGL
jgi:hypothetical protein